MRSTTRFVLAALAVALALTPREQASAVSVLIVPVEPAELVFIDAVPRDLAGLPDDQTFIHRVDGEIASIGDFAGAWYERIVPGRHDITLHRTATSAAFARFDRIDCAPGERHAVVLHLDTQGSLVATLVWLPRAGERRLALVFNGALGEPFDAHLRSDDDYLLIAGLENGAGEYGEIAEWGTWFAYSHAGSSEDLSADTQLFRTGGAEGEGAVGLWVIAGSPETGRGALVYHSIPD